MSNFTYGLLIGKIIEIKTDPVDEKTPHYNLVVATENNERYGAMINCKSTDDTLVLYYCDENCQTELIDKLRDMDIGFHEIDDSNNKNANIAIDYIRSGLLNWEDMKPLPYDVEGENDLKAIIDKNMKNALNNDNATVYVFGRYFEDGKNKGIHNIHMNQGNRGDYEIENQIYQDGCIFIKFSSEGRWVAYYFAFQNQSWNTDEKGNPRD